MNDRVRVKTKKDIYSNGDIQQFSKDIYQIIEKKVNMNKLKKLNNGEEVKRLYTNEELDITKEEDRVGKFSTRSKATRSRVSSAQYKEIYCTEKKT